MTKKTAVVTARINATVKEKAEAILSRLGISQATAIDMLYHQVITHNGIPFPITLSVSVQDFDQLLIQPYPGKTGPATEDQSCGTTGEMTDLSLPGSEPYYDYGFDGEGDDPFFETNDYSTGENDDNDCNTLGTADYT